MGRTLIVGDVHGCKAELSALLDSTKFTTGDQLVLVGDLLARGPDSLGVLDVARRAGALFVRGNHEEKLIVWHREEQAHEHGGPEPRPLGRMHAEVARALRPIDWSMLTNAPLWLDLPEHRLRVVHAGVLPGVPIEQQKRKTLLRIRSIGPDGEAIATRDGGRPWAATYRGPPHVVFGHNASPAPQLYRSATCLDTGCVYGGRLTALILSEGQGVPLDFRARGRQLVSVQARRAYYYAPQYASRRVA
jgi:calcineurin-like phosphoesterase family protein